MTTAFVCFVIAIITGLFFGAGLFLIKRIKPRDTELTNSGAPEGDDRHFRKY